VAGGVTVNENVGNFTGALGEGMELELRVHDMRFVARRELDDGSWPFSCKSVDAVVFPNLSEPFAEIWPAFVEDRSWQF
jgi:hypothetical protein